MKGEKLQKSDIVAVDCEVFKYDWLVVLKELGREEYTVYHNDENGVRNYIRNYRKPVLLGFNIGGYDRYILTLIMAGTRNETLKIRSNNIIAGTDPFWQDPVLKGGASFPYIDVTADMAKGLSLKAIAGHLGENIKECDVDFDIDRPLTPEELEAVTEYCKNDTRLTEKVFDMRRNYFNNKIILARYEGLDERTAAGKSAAGLAVMCLDTKPVLPGGIDGREYLPPANLLTEYIPGDVMEFLQNKCGPNASAEEYIDFNIGNCCCRAGLGGLHGIGDRGAICAGNRHKIISVDISSYYPNLIINEKYYPHGINKPAQYDDIVNARMQAKREGRIVRANALKLIINATYGAMQYPKSKLYDPFAAHCICATGQLRMVELLGHLAAALGDALNIIQVNTDGFIVYIPSEKENEFMRIVNEWAGRSKLERNIKYINRIFQKDVNNYIAEYTDGEVKTAGAYMTHGISSDGYFNINNNMNIVRRAVLDCALHGIQIRDTIEKETDVKQFQIIAKSTGDKTIRKNADGTTDTFQKVNRVYAAKSPVPGTLYSVLSDKSGLAVGLSNKTSKTVGLPDKNAETVGLPDKENRIVGLPDRCLVDNTGDGVGIDDIDKEWYMHLARRMAFDFIYNKEEIRHGST